jgi:hypothetical protein
LFFNPLINRSTSATMVYSPENCITLIIAA